MEWTGEEIVSFTVDVVHFLDLVPELPARLHKQVEVRLVPFGGCCNPGAWKLGQGMEPEAIY